MTVRGRRVGVRPISGYAFVQDVRVGRDGSLLVTRRTSRDSYSVHDFIRVGDRERMVAFGDRAAHVVAYRDARNDVATYVEEEGAAQVPLSPPTTYVVRDGRPAKGGFGGPVKVFGLDDLLLSVPVDARGQPSGLERTVGERLVLHRRDRVVEFGDFRFAVSLPNRGLVLTRGDELREWRDGGFVSARRLPAGWRVNAANARGELLLRRPLRFPRPKGSERLLWREPATFTPDRRIRLTAFYGDEERSFELRPKG